MDPGNEGWGFGGHLLPSSFFMSILGILWKDIKFQEIIINKVKHKFKL